jgi:hypothetical protein
MFTVSLSPKPAMLKKPLSLCEKVVLLNFLLDVLKKIARDNFIKMKFFFKPSPWWFSRSWKRALRRGFLIR